MSELKTIRLYGKLGTKFGRVHRMAVSNPAEAVQALCSQFAGFEKYLTEAKDHGFGFAVFAGKRNLSEDQLTAPTGGDDIRIAPFTFGAKKQGVLQIIIGVILIVVGAIMSYVVPGSGVGIIQMGIAMVVGGVVQMLMPAPKAPDSRDSAAANASYTFNGPVNTQAQGNPVPVLYGRLTVGSAVISAGIITEQHQYAGRLYSPSYSGGGMITDAVIRAAF